MYLLFDIGATKMRLGLSNDGKTIGETKIVATPQNFEKAIAKFRDLFNEIVGHQKIDKSAGGIRGVLNKNKEKLVKDVLLADWMDKPLGKKIAEITSSRVYLENDTAMCGLGEAVYGAGKGKRIVAYITISSGVGGVRIVNNEIDKSTFGFEPGHQIIDADASLFKDSKKEFLELEDCISGKSLQKRFRIDPRDITEAKVWREIEKFTAVGLTNSILHWSPEVVVIGGGIAQDPQFSIVRINKYMRKFLKVFPILPEIKKGELEDFAGLYGALYRLRQLTT